MNSSLFAFFLIFLFTFLIYLPGISPSVFGGDSGDIILASWFGGVAHPPGYPLNTMIGWVFTHLPYEATVAYKANLMAAFLQAVAIGLLFLIIEKLTKNKIIALAASLTLAFNPLFWLYAHVAEVFQLLNVLVLASLFFLILWRNEHLKKSGRTKSVSTKSIYISAFFFGLAVFHHHIAILLLPAYIFLIYKTDKFIVIDLRKNLMLIFFFLLGLLPYIFIFSAFLNNAQTYWMEGLSFEDFLRLVTRAEYGTFTERSDYLVISPIGRFFQIWWYFKVFKADFGYLGISLILAGLFFLYKRKRCYFRFLLLSVFFTGPFFLFYTSFPPFDPFTKGIIERFILFSYPFWAVILGFGIYGFYKYLSQKIIFKSHNLVRGLLFLIFLTYPTVLFFINFPKTDLSGYRVEASLGRDILRDAYPPGVVSVQGDTVSFNTQYSYLVEKVNSGSILLIIGLLNKAAYRERFMSEYPQLDYPSEFRESRDINIEEVMLPLIEKNIEQVPFYSFVQFESVPDGYIWVQEGMLNRLYKNEELPKKEEIEAKLKRFRNQLEFRPDKVKGQYLQFIPEHIMSIYARTFNSLGYELMELDMLERAEEYFKLAIETHDDLYTPYVGLGDLRARSNNCSEAQNFYEKALEKDLIKTSIFYRLGRLYEVCYKDSEKARYYFKQAEELRNQVTDKFKF